MTTTKTFPNLARRLHNTPLNERQLVYRAVDAEILRELGEARMRESVLSKSPALQIGYLDLASFPREDSPTRSDELRGSRARQKEVPSGIVGVFGPWSFERRWYYYAASGPGIDLFRAREFNASWGKEARAFGYAGGLDDAGLVKMSKGFAVGSYHIDTITGLVAFVALLDEVWIR